MPPILSAIVAMGENRVIGRNNQLPWHLPADLKHFKTVTTGHVILMGRKTHESIGRPLPNRINVVLTRDRDYAAPGITVVHSLDQALSAHPTEDEIFIIGGADVYRQALPRLSRLYLTLIHAPFEGDTVFPEWNHAEWREISREDHPADEANAYDYSFVTLAR